MSNISQAPVTEKKGANALLSFKIFGMPLPLYAFALITLLLSHFNDSLPNDLVGGFAIMFIIGAILVRLVSVCRYLTNILVAHQ